uniref:Hypothetical secreted peptide n=1 Tax=Glossina morsitans morsitans TaxID=37546 RepID=D3TSN4_GLOMM
MRVLLLNIFFLQLSKLFSCTFYFYFFRNNSFLSVFTFRVMLLCYARFFTIEK